MAKEGTSIWTREHMKFFRVFREAKMTMSSKFSGLFFMFLVILGSLVIFTLKTQITFFYRKN